MNFFVKSNNILKQSGDCLIVPIYKGKTVNETIKSIDTLNDNLITKLIKSGDLSSEVGKTLVLYHVPNLKIKCVIFVGCGEKRHFSQKTQYSVMKSGIDKIIETKSQRVIFDFKNISKSSVYQSVRYFIETLNDKLYCFDEYKSQKSTPLTLSSVTFNLTDKRQHSDALLAIEHGQAIAKAITATKTLANQPSNIGNAAFLSEKGKQLSQTYPAIKTKIHGEKALEKLGMNAYLAVGRGSDNESIMTVMEYQGSKDKKSQPIVLVGKGLTFDSGGISIKPAAGMDEMKYDMCGAATVYGVMSAIAELKLPINVVGVMAGCENMPGSNAYRPGDILTTMSGKTVEVINTDAEGRLVLCDVLTYVEQYQPKAVIDIATLTGACIIALGHHYTGVMGNDDNLINELIQASHQANDKAWQLPIDEDFQKQIESTCADIVNSAGREGGTITAACFLSQFTQNYHWAHLDIAGTAWKSGASKGATGRPVAMLVQFLINQSH